MTTRMNAQSQPASAIATHPTASLKQVSFWYESQLTQNRSFYESSKRKNSNSDSNSDPDSVEPHHNPSASAPVLHDISFTCQPGTTTLLCGASGSGKSTIVQLLNGLIPNFHGGRLDGEIRVAGHEISKGDLSAAGQLSATVFQNPQTQFFAHDVLNEMALRMENAAVPREAMIDEITTIADEFGIRNLLRHRLQELSGGELQHVACAQAVSAQTPLLLFDEPTSNLSPTAISQLRSILARLRSQHRTMIIAEHRLYYLRDLVDTVIELEAGTIARNMPAEQFFAQDDHQRRTRGLRTLVPPFIEIEQETQEEHIAKLSQLSFKDHQDDVENLGLRITNLNYAYGLQQVLRIDYAHFPAHAITVLTGDNGVGKTTLARIICGLLPASSNCEISMDWKPLTAKERIKNSYIVMQDVHRQLFTDTVRTELTLGLSSQKEPDTGRDIDAILEELDLVDIEDSHPLSLSGGQQQRVVIGSAMAANTRIYIFDEPTSGVDYRHLTAIASRMRALAEQGAVVIVITHDNELVQTCADYVATLHTLRKEHGARTAHPRSQITFSVVKRESCQA